MQTIRTVLFDHAERETLDAAHNLIHIAYSTKSEPLTPAAQAVEDDDPRLRVVGALARNACDPVALPRLRTAARALRGLLEAVEREASEEHWREAVKGRDLSPTEQEMTAVLVTERRRQVPTVREALEIVERALAALTERDDPNYWRDAWADW